MTSSPDTCSPGRATGCGGAETDPGPTAALERDRRRSPIGSSAGISYGHRTLPIALLGLLALVLLAPLPAPSAGEELVVESDQTIVVDLKYRPADEVLQAVAPHLAGRQITMSAADDRILLHGPTRDLGIMIDLIQAVDIPPRQLWISVSSDRASPATGLRVGPDSQTADVRFATGGRALSAASGGGTSFASHWQTGRDEVRRVLVREGEWAAVAVQDVAQTSDLGARVFVAPRIEVFVPSLTGPSGPTRLRAGGFRVRPRLSGEQVVLEIAAVDANPDPAPQEPSSQAVTTTLTGRPGDWIAATGSADLQPAAPDGEPIAQTRRRGLPTLWVRVDLADPGPPPAAAP